MTLGRTVGLAGLWLVAGAPLVAAQTKAAKAIREDIKYLASDQLGGRFTGSEGGTTAARFLARRFGAVGAKPGVPGWLQSFEIAADVPGVKDLPEGSRPSKSINVVAAIRGRDPVLRDEYVIVGAHYDHLGQGNRSSSLGPVGEIHNGADDNASGSVALIEIARQLAAKPPKRSVVLVAFSGEELGLLGSAAYVRSPAVPMERSVAMVNLDMVGRLRNGRLLVFGSETATEFPALLDSLNTGPKFDLKYSGDGFGRSDQQSFYVAKKPVLHMFTDLHEDYHRPSDDWDKINIAGLEKVATYTTSIVRALADRTAPLTFIFKAPPPPPPPVAGNPAGGAASLGTIPDMASGGPGVRLSGVRPDSPAEKAGLKEGDILLGLDGFDIPDLQGMSDALRQHRPGDTVMVRFRRGARNDSVKAVLGRRGS